MMTSVLEDEAYVRRAIELARQAEAQGDVPIGAILLIGELVFEGKNEKESRPDATAHAEMLVLQAAARHVGAWRLSGATLYVTKEPCVMCAGAIVAARVDRLVYGCPDPKGGAAGSVVDLVRHSLLNHRVEVTGGVLEAETAAQLQAFFKRRR
ncbi:MAG TPA: tRNA adenosine(34) deaminase TadA [Candidatus Baltobacteraceae bacterium]|jgi:tRNA(adenine34) deaminase|nr:tRNA adenosine(34) deaminase TadA [Candidatus Baltobacteraceae bacterium]